MSKIVLGNAWNYTSRLDISVLHSRLSFGEGLCFRF